MNEYYDKYKKQQQENSILITTQSSKSNEQQNSEQSQLSKQNNKCLETSKESPRPLLQSYTKTLTQTWNKQGLEEIDHHKKEEQNKQSVQQKPLNYNFNL